MFAATSTRTLSRAAATDSALALAASMARWMRPNRSTSVSDLKEILVQRDRLRRPSSELENLIRDGIAPPHGGGRHLGRRIATGMHFGHGRASRDQISVSGSEVTVRLQRFLDQGIETRVVVQAPPGIGWWRRSFDGGFHGDQRCRRTLKQWRWPIIRPNSA